jgi:hypothetical protein
MNVMSELFGVGESVGRKNGTRSVRVSVAFTLALVIMQSSTAQEVPPMEKPAADLSYLVGDWEGAGWVYDRTGTRNTFDLFEKVLVGADGYALVVLGEGFTPEGLGRAGSPTHNAAGFISYSPSGYVMRAVTGEGRSQDVTLELTDSRFDWVLDIGPVGYIRYSTIVDDDIWTEDGFFCPVDGECWQTFHVRLERVVGGD